MSGLIFIYLWGANKYSGSKLYLLSYSYYIGQVIGKFSINIAENFRNIQNRIFGRPCCFFRTIKIPLMS